MTSWWTEHPDLEGLARRGRGELTEEAESAEHDAELLRRRRRNLTNVLFEWMSRGDLVTVSVGTNRFEGQLTAVINDLAVVQTKTIVAAINTTALTFARTDKQTAFSGSTGNRDISSFRAFLGKHEIDKTPLRLIATSGAFDLLGVIDASTDDHLVVHDQHGLEWVLSRIEIGCAISSE